MFDGGIKQESEHRADGGINKLASSLDQNLGGSE